MSWSRASKNISFEMQKEDEINGRHRELLVMMAASANLQTTPLPLRPTMSIFDHLKSLVPANSTTGSMIH